MLPRCTVAAPFDATAAAATKRDGPAALAVRIGMQSERLFDAAATKHAPSAHVALRALHEQVGQLDESSQTQFTAAGGRDENWLAARQGLLAGLARADRAAAAADWNELCMVANRMTLLAGELAQPFADAQEAPTALKVDAAMYLAWRMRQTLIAGDTSGYAAAHAAFDRLCLDLQRSAPGVDGVTLAALERALTMAALSHSAQTVNELQHAAQAVAGTRP
jgi:hypothetical protein